MPLKVELNAIKKNYVKLMKLPVNDLLPSLKMNDIVSDDQKEAMEVMKLDKQRAAYLMDTVIIPSLKLDIPEPFYSFLKVLEEEEDNLVLKAIADSLRSLLGPPMPQPQPSGQIYPPRQTSAPHGQPYAPGQPHGGQPYAPGQPHGGQPYASGQPYGQPYVCGQTYGPPPGQPYNPGPPSAGQPYPLGPQATAAQLIQVEKVLVRSSRKGIDPLPANNRNIHAVCLIKRRTTAGNELGTGFIATLTMSSSPEPVTVLVTNHHVLHNLSEAIDATYEFSYLRQDSPHTPDPIRGVDLIPQNARGFNTCKETDGEDVLLDYTIIQVHERPLNDVTIISELDGEKFSLSTCKFNLDNPATPFGNKEMETVFILHYPLGSPLKRSTQGSVSVGHLLFYSCDTDGGSSGAPVCKVVNKQLQVIALHRGHWEGVNFNFGTLINEVIRHVNQGPASRMNRWAVVNELGEQVKGGTE